MPNVLQAQDIDDIVVTTLRKLNKGKVVQIAQALQRYEVMGHWMKKGRMIWTKGYGYRQTLFDVLSDVAGHVGLYAEDPAIVADHTCFVQVNLVHARTFWIYDIIESLMNQGAERIVNMIAIRDANAYLKLAEKLEAGAWSVPYSTDDKTPNGLPYWVVFNAAQGFNGALPDTSYGHTTVGGIDPAVHDHFKNYTDVYVDPTFDDLGKKLRRAHRMVGFEPPVTRSEFMGSKGYRYRCYVNEATFSYIEDSIAQHNDNLGPDFKGVLDNPVFKKHPIIWVPYLDAEIPNPAADPFYMIDHAVFFPIVLRGNFMRQSGPNPRGGMHNVRETFVDISYQYICVNRRRCALVSKVDPMLAL